MMWCEATDFKVMQVQFSQSDGAFSRSVGEIPFTRIYCLANKPSQFWVKVCSSLLQPSCFLRPISWLTKSRPLPEQMFSPADLEVLQDLSARSQSGFWRAVGWLKRVWTPRRRFLGAWVNSSCGWWWREAVQRAFFFYRQLPFHCERTAQVNGVSDHEGLAHTDMHLGENTTHIHS